MTFPVLRFFNGNYEIGQRLKNGSWSGMLGYLQREEGIVRSCLLKIVL